MSSNSKHRVFISNLPEPYSDDQLYELCATSGEIVEASVKWTMGFVEFDSQESANKAVKDLNKRQIGGNKINAMLAALANTLTTVSAATVSSATKTPVCSRLFIGNLDEKMTKEKLESIFSPYGGVSSCEVKRSYGFVRMETLESAVAARQALDRQKDQNFGKPLRIDFAEPRRKAKLFVGGLAEGQSQEEIKETFSKFGVVLGVSLMDRFGFVTFDDDNDAQKAVTALHHTMLNGSKIKVEVSTSDKAAEGNTKGDDTCHRCGETGHFARECGAVGPPASKRPRGGAGGGRSHSRALSPGADYLMTRYADPYGPPSRDPYGYPARPDPYGRPDPYDAYPRGGGAGGDPYGYPGRESAVSYPGYGGRSLSAVYDRPPLSAAYDLPGYERSMEGRRKPLMSFDAKPDRSGGKPNMKRSRR